MLPRVRSTIAAATVAVALLSACGSPAATQPAPAEPASAGRASLIGGPLSVTTTDGRGLRVPDGEHPTVLYFMAAWCVSCIQGARDLAQLHRDYGTRGLRVLAIDADQNESADDLARFRGLAGDPEYDWALDSGGRITQALAIRSLDATILVSPKGEVLFRSESLPNPSTLRRAVQRALGL